MGNNNTIISDKSQLVEWVAAGAKPSDLWRIGTEHEKFLFHRDGISPVAYDGPSGVAEVLTTLCVEIGEKASPIMEAGHIIGLKDGAGGSVTLEPGGQLELSGAPLENLHQTCAETGRHLRHMRAVSDALGLGMLGIAFCTSAAPCPRPWAACAATDCAAFATQGRTRTPKGARKPRNKTRKAWASTKSQRNAKCNGRRADWT